MDMGQEDACDTGLALGLNYNASGLSSDRHGHREAVVKLELSPSNMVSLEPSLTLGLPDDVKKAKVEARVARQSSPHSTVSSFSDGHPSSTKKENSIRSEEAEKVSFRVSDEEEEGSARKKLRLTKDQSALLEDRFKEQSTLNPKQKQALAKQLNLRPRQVEVWFQNRRARTKLKQTEFDCEVLKRCCETLSDENRRLKKELHELRALKSASPLYMQFPAAALTMCPSCKKITAASEGSKAGPFVTAPKPHLFMNSFTHSAAC
ncbi:homeobox-leucine zipper protein HAT22-like [Phoenix dactylifera]|uniref:Homeobox-leucine zipper protein HAT22-like n=1 Tax=Phoenix dactylifera TaxID=42345 RepID=A0A8B8ZLQ8_PHODC|nr:homeobox-leucine zipper protein HAT22-like [Phoenix dactylifera]XP_038975141.1 homeobox-leucine zipper protein HAT22-like [Phoenix dactylifera]